MLHLSETASGGGSGTVPQDQDSWLVSLLLHAPLCAPSLCHVWLGASVPLLTEANGGILQRQGLRSSGGSLRKEPSSMWLSPGSPLLGRVMFRVEGGIYGFCPSKGSGE